MSGVVALAVIEVKQAKYAFSFYDKKEVKIENDMFGMND